jgi:hypothetical protein
VERRRSIASRVPTIIKIVVVTVLVCVLSPLTKIDELIAVNLLRVTKKTSPISEVVRLKISVEGLRECPFVWTERLHSANVRASVLIEPLNVLCPISGSHSLEWSHIRRDGLGRVVGFVRIPFLRQLQNDNRIWIRPIAANALPTLFSDSEINGDLRNELMSQKTVILTLDGNRTTDERLEETVLLLAAAIEPGAFRRLIPIYIVSLLSVVWVMAWLYTVEKRGYRNGVVVGILVFSAFVFATVGLSVYVTYSILPIATMSLSFLFGVATKEIPAQFAERRALRRANQLVERAALIRLRGLDQLDDAEFHGRLAGLAEQWHPANLVLIAQLPAKKWHLQFWNNGSAGENLIAERRRDIRRTPYCDEQGVPAIRVVRNYLAVKEMPVLVVPLIALGEIEGYVFLCGDRAEQGFRNDPTVAHRMSLELAMLMRRRRLGRASTEELYDEKRRSTRAKNMVVGAQTVTEEMELLGAMVRDAPTGILLADAFGQIRMVGKLFHDWLTAFGITLPAAREDAMLAPGTLSLVSVLQTLASSDAETAQKRIADLSSTPAGLTIHFCAPKSAGGESLTLRCVAIRRRALSVDHVGGFVAVLSKTEEERVVTNNVVPLTVGDDLSAFVLLSAVEEAVDGANRTAVRRVILEPSVSSAQCIAKRWRLVSALRGFLQESANEQSPVVVIREKSREVEVVVHDLDLGVPMGAIERVLNAPHHPPPGLETLGRLILAIEECHGSMRLAKARGWGIRLVIRLHRARSVVVAGVSRHPAAVAVSEGQVRSSMVPPALPRSRRPPPISE